MAVYKIFPDKDATLYSIFPEMNTGLDEIVEATLTTFAYSNPNPQVSRFVIHFTQEEIETSYQDIIKSIEENSSKEIIKSKDITGIKYS